MHMKSVKKFLFVLFVLLFYRGLSAGVAYASEVYYYENGLSYGLLYDENYRETGNVEVSYPDCTFDMGYGSEPDIIVPESVEIRGKVYRVTRVAEYGFCRLDSLESISLPSSVTELGDCAFSGCWSLARITAANPDINAQVSAFTDTAWLESQTEDFIVINNYLVKYQGTAANVKIPDGIKTIGSLAFLDNDKLKTVTMPDTVERIDDAAFSFCNKLNKVTFSRSLKYIGDRAFSGTDLTSVSFPDSLEVIGENAFSTLNLTELKLNNGLKEIGTEAFSFTPIKKLTIPKTVKTIGEMAFWYCEDLTSVTIGNGVKTIESAAFDHCKNLSKVVIPSSVSYIANGAFDNTKWYDKLSDEFCIVNHLLIKYNGKSKTVKIPKGVTKILCTIRDLEKVVFPSSLNEIGTGAFYGNIKEITIPGHVKTIGIGAFTECGLKKVTIENGVTVIDGGAFSANQLTSVTIPKSVVKIGSDAFSYNKKLTSVKFSEGKLEYIGENAFNKCDLRSFSPPSTVRFMGVCLLEFNDNLESISIPASMNTVPFTSRDSDFKKLTKLVIARGVKAIENITKYPKLKTIELPDTLISINPSTFSDSNIEKLYIPEGTNFIGFCAFAQCKKLKEVSIPDSVKYISRYAFHNSEQVVFRCNENSTAYLYAQEHGFKVVGPYVKK